MTPTSSTVTHPQFSPGTERGSDRPRSHRGRTLPLIFNLRVRLGSYFPRPPGGSVRGRGGEEGTVGVDGSEGALDWSGPLGPVTTGLGLLGLSPSKGPQERRGLGVLPVDSGVDGVSTRLWDALDVVLGPRVP